MRKGIAMRVKVYIEGDAAPTDDFQKIGDTVVRQILAEGIKAAAGQYVVQVQDVQPLEGSDDSDEG
jgi:hypothetical protein